MLFHYFFKQYTYFTHEGIQRKRVWRKITEKKNINKMPPALMQIVDPSIDLPLALFLPSIPPSTLSHLWRYHPSSCTYQFISPHISFHIFPSHHSFSHVHLSEKCVCARVSVIESARETLWAKKMNVNINYSTETVKRLVAANESVFAFSLS